MKFFWTLLFVILALPIFSQQKKSSSTLVSDEVIIQLKEGTDASVFFQKIKKQLRGSDVALQSEKKFSDLFNLFLLKTNENIEDVNSLLQFLKNNTEVTLAGQNFQLEQRDREPNDPRFTDQWGMAKINAPAVWDITTGGVTALGDTIVVAVMESGDWQHEDLIGNHWINWNEIEDDGIDNDGNGFIDDYHGWNSADSSDLIGNDFGGHGTRVAGIIGASGDNGMGVSGVNWKVKLMSVHSNLFFDQIVAAYEYVYKNRKLYNETNGEKGAFIVATNASFGVSGNSSNYPDGLQVEDNQFFGLWCAMHQSLGEVGVLNVGSTDNSSYDVDELGDMPSVCISDHLIVVAESNQEDELGSAFGKTLVDLSAPGQGSPSTSLNNNYGTLGGTSAAAPHVAGGIALLYSLPCEKLALAAKEDPASASLAMKSFIMNGVDEIADQSDKTVTGGRLNLETSMALVNEFCGSGIGTLNIDNLSPNPTNSFLDIAFTPNEFGTYEVAVFNSIGQLMLQSQYEAKQFLPASFRLEDLRGWRAGVYFLRISNNLDYTTTRFVVY